MKKSILALGAAAVVGGLGFAGSAHAIAYFGPSTHPTAAQALGVELNPGGTGHYLFVPYFSTQGSIGSMFQIANTDTANAKAVKVRFRGAANSDDVLDFTLFLSPGDVWAGSLTRGADGRGTLTSQAGDTSCTLPAGPYKAVPFKYERTSDKLTEANRFAHTREGYVEVMNMADIPPFLADGTTVNKLYTNVKHAKDASGVWKAPCVATGFDTLRSTTVVTQAQAEAAGLRAPTGHLMGSWAVMNQAELAVYGSSMTAIHAVVSSSTATSAAVPGFGNIAFAPQQGVGTNLTQAVVDAATADPLLRGAAPRVTPLWFDLPDMSTPLVAAYAGNPLAQASALSSALAKPSILNEYSAADAPVPMDTDWVVSQPTRRYHAAVDYGNEGRLTSPVIAFNNDMASATSTVVTTTPANNVYRNLSLETREAMGPYACLTAGFYSFDREERDDYVAPSDDFSPGKPAKVGTFCGEVFTLSFGSATSRVLQSQIANNPAPATAGQFGWARLQLNGASLPVTGFAATSAVNRDTRGNFGLTIPHRW